VKNFDSRNEVHVIGEERNKDENGSFKNSDTSMLKQALLDRSTSETCSESPQHTCPFCNYTSSSEVRIQMHVVAQHSQKPSTLACPLCQDSFREWGILENHLMDTHHVNKEGVKRLMALVDKTEWMAAQTAAGSDKQQAENNVKLENETVPPKPITNGPTATPVSASTTNSDTSLDEGIEVKQEMPDLECRSDDSDGKDEEDFTCAACGRIFTQVEDLFCHQNEMGHLEYKNTPKGNGFFCWKKGCGLFFGTMTATQFHYKEMHALKSNIPVSERHVYKYRCTQCSLAFKTSEKLQLHMQYHIIRAATKCVLCGRSFRTVLALQKHVETSHSDMTKDELEQYRASLMNNPLLTGNGGASGGVLDPQTTELLKKESNREELDDDLPDETISIADDSDITDDLIEEGNETKEQQVLEDYINSQAMAEDSYNDPNRKYKCHRCKVAFTRQSYLTSHNKTLLHRKGEKMSYPMEKYLDPNRPFKCEVCKESFTQKNILLVHFNSVSHLHKLKLSMKENNTANSTTPTSSAPSTRVSSPVLPTISSANANSTTTNVSQSSAINEGEKKPYKCNLCKVSYTQASTLDIHIRSVLHQTKASKLNELDLSIPAIERPDSAPSAEQNQTKTPDITGSVSDIPTSNSVTVSAQNTKISEPSAQAVFTTTTSSVTPVASSPQFSFPLHPDHNNIMQQALNLMPPSSIMQSQVSPPFSCSRCGTMCASQEALLQHQQMYCFFAQTQLPPILNAAPTASQPPLIPPTLTQMQQRQQTERDEPPEKQQRSMNHPETSASPVIQMNHSATQRSPTPGQQMFRSRFPFLRPKPLIFRHLLESFGFDVVMQFNENSQRRPKKDVDKKEEQKENDLKNNEQGEKESLKRKFDLPEINRSICNKCGKGFSGIWVLKAHQEEAHKDIVPLKEVEKFAEEFRDDYERRNASVSVIDDVNNLAEAPSPSSSGELSTGPSSTPATPSGATPLSLPSAVTPPVTSLGSQMPDVASSVTANHMAAQMQFNQILMSMGLGMGLPMSMNMGMNMNLPFAAAMNMHPPLIPLMMPPPLDPLMAASAAAFGHPMMPGAAVDPNFFAAQQKLLQQQQLSQQQKRARTRINDDQLKILRAYFDINNSPTEDQLLEMSDKSGLPLKVIKHWFRNTLFKERQRNKDSPYNFNNPPSTYLNLEEYEKTGEAKITPVNNEKPNTPKTSESQSSEKKEQTLNESEKNDEFSEMNSKEVKIERYSNNDCQKVEQQPQSKRNENNISFSSCMTSAASDLFSMSDALSCATSCAPTSSALMSMDLRTSLAESFSCNLNPFASTSSMMPLMPPTSASPPTSESPHSTGTPSGTPTPSCSSSGKRANRTRFTDYQIKVLQEFFETNAYPKDDDLEYLSKLLNLSPRVIVVWFQNARQKARKVYENQPPITAEEENAGRFQRTPGLNYQCKKCLQVFQRYYELIKHQKSSCFKDENPLAVQIKVMSGDERSSQAATPTLATSLAPSTPVSLPRTSEKFSGNSNQNGTYRCDKCSLSFPRFDLWREHQLVHMMNPNLFSNYQPSSFSVLQYDTPTGPGSLPLAQMKRKMSDDEESQSDHPRDKRLRTTILPEQLDYLYQQYQVESNPSRKMLENIAREVGLKKRVVQVWFQNTRARERKGQFRAHQQVIHKRCPFCRALFKARSALESHLATRHADQYTKGDINIDALPDGECDSNPEDPGSPSEDKTLTSGASPSQNFPSNSTDVVNSTMKRYYEDSLRKYLDELCGIPNSRENCKDPSLVTDMSLCKASEKSSAAESPTKGESPLDLSKPLKALMEKSNGSLAERFHLEDGTSRGGLMDDARSETYSESTDNMDGEESNPTSPSSRYSSSSSKRFRTQMTTVQLKVMKSIFVDYKTPSMCECESLGKEIGLPKRVVQVWFQNARAKEKKAKLAFVKTFGHEMEPSKVSDECTLCNVKYNLKFSPSTLQEHIFSKKHIENLKNHIDSLKKLTDGQDSDTAPSYEPMTTPNHVTSNSVSSSSPTVNSTLKQTGMVSMSGLTGGLPSFGSASTNLDKLKNETSLDSSVGQRKETTANGDLGSIKDKQEEKEDNLTPAPNSSQENHTLDDFVLPTTSTESSSTPSSAAGLIPYMYAGFPSYYGNMPGALFHHAMYPGRTKL
ncbi:zinc finger homeobox protein 3-like, partial [Stegodyphus dumicola]|uniref:zinc finger homeobox protein 3-like n=1 Tax=Stegodyphus dumicola TaxID=202533 RepID=UPI0015B04D09